MGRRAAGVTPQLLVFPVLWLLPCADETDGAPVGPVIRQDEDGHGQTADKEDGVHGALSVEVGFLGKLLELSRLFPLVCGKAAMKGLLPSGDFYAVAVPAGVVF